MLSTIDPLGNETQNIYDARDRLIETIDPNNGSTLFTYDLDDNLISIIDPLGNKTSFTYDARNRLISETDPLGQVSQFEYDLVGNILSVTDTIDGVVGGTNNYTYDALNRLTNLTQSGNGVNDKRVDFGYNALGQFTSIDRYSDLNATQLVTGTDYAYDTLNRLTNLTHNNGTTDVAFYDFVYDEDSRITQITDIDGVTDYNYDNRDQLIGVDRSDVDNPDETYTYDANGNRISSSIHNDGYVTGDGNRLLSDGTFDYEYDNEGNLISQTEIATGNIRELEWDYRNRLIAVIDKDSNGNETQRVEFTYDAFDRRISKSVDTNPQDTNDAVVAHFVYDGDDVLLDFVDDDGVSGSDQPTLEQRYLHGANVDQILAQEDETGTVLWHLTDQLGTVRDLVDDSGTLANHFIYDSFGNVIDETDSTVDTRYLFTGREFDPEIGLQYNRARYYNASTGRWVSEDPIKFGGGDVNLYRYVFNNSVGFNDPIGLAPTLEQQLDLANKQFNETSDALRDALEFQNSSNNTLFLVDRAIDTGFTLVGASVGNVVNAATRTSLTTGANTVAGQLVQSGQLTQAGTSLTGKALNFAVASGAGAATGSVIRNGGIIGTKSFSTNAVREDIQNLIDALELEADRRFRELQELRQKLREQC